MTSEPVRAKDAYVMHLYQARCRLCDWSSEIADNYQTANIDRQVHLDEHRTLLATLAP